MTLGFILNANFSQLAVTLWSAMMTKILRLHLGSRRKIHGLIGNVCHGHEMGRGWMLTMSVLWPCHSSFPSHTTPSLVPYPEYAQKIYLLNGYVTRMIVYETHSVGRVTGSGRWEDELDRRERGNSCCQFWNQIHRCGDRWDLQSTFLTSVCLSLAHPTKLSVNTEFSVFLSEGSFFWHALLPCLR